MKKVIAYSIGVILALPIAVGISALMAWLLSWGIAFAFDYEIGFLRTWAGMVVLQIISNIVFSGMRRQESK